MSWVFIASIVAMLVAIVLIEYRALRVGDERRHYAPGATIVVGGLILIGIGIAAAVSEQVALSLLASSAGLLAVAFAVTRHAEASAH